MRNEDFQYINQEDFNFLVKNGKRNSKLLNFDFESLIYSSWGFVKETIPELFANNDFEQLLFLMLKDRKQKVFCLGDVRQININEAMAFILWLIDEMKAINDLESQFLKSDPDPKMINAGIHKLDQFGIKNILDNLTDGKIWEYDKIRNMPYNDVFDKQYMEIVKSEVEKKLSKIK